MGRAFGGLLRTLKAIAATAVLGMAVAGCTTNSAKKHYNLAEKLWADGKYSSAVAEFDKVTSKDPKGKLGLQALFRSASTQALFLSQYDEAARKFKAYSEAPGADPQLAWDAQKQIGEILYSKTEQYDRAIQHYQSLLKRKPGAPEAAEFSFRIARSHFFLWKFDDAVELYEEVMSSFPGTPWAERAAYEIGVTYFTRGEQRPGGGRDRDETAYQDAIDAYQSFLKRYSQSALVPQAKFGIASCLEEMDQLDAAYKVYESIQSTYPSPNVIKIKMVRIRERQAQRSR